MNENRIHPRNLKLEILQGRLESILLERKKNSRDYPQKESERDRKRASETERERARQKESETERGCGLGR